MKKIALIFFYLLLYSCVTTLEPEKIVLDVEQFKLIEKILKHPEYISILSNDSSLVDQHFIDVFSSEIQINWLIFHINKNFQGTNKIIKIEQLNDIERLVILNMKSKRKIFFNFKLLNSQKKLYLINSPTKL